jgi:hypothetical protein
MPMPAMRSTTSYLAHLVLIVTLTLSLAFQALMAGGPVQGGAAGAARHLVAHWLGIEHHHHPDGRIHQDQSPASRQHQVADGSNASTTPVDPSPLVLPMQSRHALRVTRDPAPPTVDLDVRLRPPIPLA